VLFRSVIAGVGVGGSIPSVFTLYTEYLPTKRRGMLLSIVAAFWTVGTVFTAGLAWILLGALDLSWRWFAVCASTPAIASALIVALYLPESPRFLFSVGNYDACSACVVLIATRCGKVSTLSQPDARLERNDGSYSAQRYSPWYRTARKVFHPTLLRTTVLLVVAWATLSFGWYGLNIWIPTLLDKVHAPLNTYTSAFVIAAASLPGNFASLYILDRFGRKRVLSLSMIASGVFAMTFALVDKPVLLVVLVSLLNAVAILGWNALDCLSSESFPTTLRSSAMGVLAAAGRIGSIGGQFVFSWLVDVSVPALMTVAAGMLFLGGLAGFLLPQETTGMQLQQDVPTIEEDGEDDSQPLGSARVLRSDGRYQPATSALEIENYGEEY